MRRSDMENQIAIFIQECLERDGFSYQDTADSLIDFIESYGMLPPSYEGLVRSGQKFVQELHQGSDTMLIRNRWEPGE